jgi:hypothetical protein
MTINEANQKRLKRVEAFARLMDAQFKIPFTPISIGVDGLIGIIPFVGDGVSLILALYPVLEAHRIGVSTGLKLKMLVNILIDTVIGAIPIIGDVFDIGFKANLRNAQLIREFLEQQG